MAETGLAFELVACGCTTVGFAIVAGFSPRGLIEGFGASDAFSFDQTPPQQGFVQQGSNAGQSNNPFF